MTHAGYNRIIEPNIQSNMKLRNPNNSDQKHVSETHLSSSQQHNSNSNDET
jgi:hypothetical protein